MNLIDLIKTKNVSIKFNVNTYDIDLAGHLNNIVYIRWLEDLRHKLFDKIFNFSNIVNDGLYPVVIHTSINYRKQIKIYDKPIGYMDLVKFNHNIFFLEAKILLGDQVSSASNQKCVIINLKTSQMINSDLLQKYIR